MPPASPLLVFFLFLTGPRRWVAFFAAILVFMVAGGSPFLFPVYSKAIKTSLGYDNKALTMLAFSKNLGGSLGFLPSALVYDVAPPWAVLPSVAAMNLLGVLAYLVPYMATVSGRMRRRIGRPAVWWLMRISIAVGANSQSFAMTGALVSTVKNFPDHRGPVVTLLLAFAGIGGDIITQLARGASEDDGAALLLLIMPCLCFVLLLFTWSSIRVVPAPAGAARPGIQGTGVGRFLVVSALAFAFLLIFNVLDLLLPAAHRHIPGTAYYVTAIVLLVAVVISLLGVAVKQESEEEDEPARGVVVVVHRFVLSNNNNDPSPSSFRMQCYSILRAVFSIDMLLMFLVTFAIGGGVQTPIDMMDQMEQSLGYKHKHGASASATSKLVSLVSLLDYAGRLVGGFGSEYIVARYKLPRPAALTVAFVLAFVGHVLIGLGVPSGLYSAAVIMGFCLGALWTMVFVTILEVFGAQHLAALYNLAVLPGAVGSYILNLQVTRRLYESDEAAADHHHTCANVQCFRKYFFILVGGVTLLGGVVSAILAWRVSAFYRAPIRATAVVGVAAPATADHDSSQVEAVSSSIKLHAMDVESSFF